MTKAVVICSTAFVISITLRLLLYQQCYKECTCSYLRNVLKVILSDNFSNFPTLYKKDKERAKKQVLYVFSPHLHLLTFFQTTY